MKRCIDCEHFAFWDNDWCCTFKMQIISGIDKNTNKTLNPEKAEMENNCENFRDASEISTLRHLRLRNEIWENFKSGNF